MRLKLIFSLILLMLICGTMGPLFAEGPTTPKILFTSTRDGNHEVYIMNPDGSEQVNLTQHPARDAGGVWSPTGEQILFVSDRGGVRALYVMDADGTNVRRVFTVFILNRDGTGLRQLVEEAGPGAGPSALSPDGSEVVYTQEINGHEQIFKLDINSGVRTQLTHIGGAFRQANIGGDWFDPAYALPVSPQPALLTTTWGEIKKEEAP